MATEYGQRLRAARKHAKLTQEQAGEKTGIPQSTISTAERNGLGSADTPVYAKAYGVDAHWLATGEGDMLRSSVAASPFCGSQVIVGTGADGGRRAQEVKAHLIEYMKIDASRIMVVAGDAANSLADSMQSLSPAHQAGTPAVQVPLLANSGSMGIGSDMQHDDVLVGHIALSEQWVAKRLQPTSPTALRFIHAYGDSMSPTFEDGDVLLVDTGMRDPKAIDGVYVMAANDRLYIKRVRQRMDKALEISSDNATVKTVDVLNGDHSIDILGRVVWCWNGRKL